MTAAALCLILTAVAPDAGEVDGGGAIEPPVLLQDSPLRATSPVDATVILNLIVDENGEVSEARIAQSAGPELDAAALDASTLLRFSPARLDGRPVPSQIEFRYHVEAAPPLPPPAALLTGVVRSMGNRREIAGATLLPERGSATDADPHGHFALELPPGAQSLRVSAPGFKPKTFREEVAAGQHVEVAYALEPERINPYETIVQGERERTELSRVTLRGQEIHEVPGTMGDPFRVVMLLPGVASVLSGISYPVVRGTEPAATGYFIDGIRVPILFHLGLGPAVIHPDFIESLDFYPGSPPAEYGRLLGGAVDGRIARFRDDRLHATAYADLINAGGFVEAPFPSTGTDVTLAGRFSYSAWLTSIVASALEHPGDPKPTLNFGDYQARVEQKWLGWQFRLFAFGSSDAFGAVSTDPDTGVRDGQLEHITFHRADLRARHALGPGELELGVTAGIDQISFDNVDRDRFDVSEPDVDIRALWNATLAEGVQLKLGADVDHRIANASTVLETPNCAGKCDLTTSSTGGTATFSGLYAQLIWDRWPGWRLIPGIRADDYHLVPGMDFVAVEPRLTVRRTLSERWTLKGAAGLFHQPPTALIDLPVIDVSGLHYGLQQAIQLDTGVEWKPHPAIEINADAYVNPLTRTVEIDPFRNDAQGLRGVNGVFSVATTESPATHGLAYGLELLIRHPIGGNWFGWLSLTLERSTRYTGFVRFDGAGNPVGVGFANLPFTLDQTFVLNGVLSYRLPRNWTVGAAVHFNTGRPESGDLTSSTEMPSLSGTAWIHVSQDQVNRLPSFFRVDARVQKSWVFDRFALDLYLDALNATASSEVVSYDYQIDRFTGALVKKTNSVPLVIPTLGLRGTY